MPELPEVETVRAGLAALLPGQKLHDVVLRRPDLRWPIPAAAVRDLVGRRVHGIERRAKYLLLSFTGRERPVAIVHLGMTGRLLAEPPKPEPAWSKHEHWRMRFSKHLLRFIDARRFGALDVTPQSALPRHKLIAVLGPEPLGGAWDGDELFARSRGRRVAVKSYLMNASEVVGVGNIYASEACFRAGIRPGRSIGRTTREECHALADAVREVLRDAIRQGGTTFRDYARVDASTGEFQRELAVYDRAGEECRRCGATIKRTSRLGRSTYYCPVCQR
jgi:formamidopyrimidine-DNA glycosylase